MIAAQNPVHVNDWLIPLTRDRHVKQDGHASKHVEKHCERQYFHAACHDLGLRDGKYMYSDDTTCTCMYCLSVCTRMYALSTPYIQVTLDNNDTHF